MHSGGYFNEDFVQLFVHHIHDLFRLRIMKYFCRVFLFSDQFLNMPVG